MGGGATFTPISVSVDRLENIARREIRRERPTEPRRRVFISFRGEDKEPVDSFREQAKDENSDIDFIDFSLRVPFNSDDAEYIKRGIMERIKNSLVTVVFIGDTTHESKWVDWEIRESISLGKGVVAVNSKDGVKTPRALKENEITPIPLREQSKIGQAIQEAAGD